MSCNQNSACAPSHFLANGASPPPYSATADMCCNSPTHPNFTPHDDAALRSPSSSFLSYGSGGSVIYTPPLTPRSCSSSNIQDDHSPQQQHHQKQQPVPPAQQDAAALYFESRPGPATEDGRHSDVIIIYAIRAQASSVLDDFPYQDHWAARGVTSQDWAAFVRSLPTGHGTGGNEAVLYGQLRSMETRIKQWNDGFFGPRGMNLVLESHETGLDWQQEVEECITSLRGLTVDDDSYSGNTGLGDKNGISTSRTWDAMETDEVEEQYGDARPATRHTGVPDSNEAYRHATFGGPLPPGPFLGSFHGSAGWSRDGLEQDYDSGGIHHCHYVDGGHDDQHQRWWHNRHALLDENRQRTSSASSTSSPVAFNSSASSSIGSVPGYDDIKENHLPFYAEGLHDWATHPDRMRPGNDVQSFQAELKTATTHKNDAVAAMDKRALKRQVRALQEQWTAIKAVQRRTLSAHKQERRQQRRVEKLERRQRDRGLKMAYRNLRKVKAGPLPFSFTLWRAPTAAPEHMSWIPGLQQGWRARPTQHSSSLFRPVEPFRPRGRALERRRQFLDGRPPAFVDTDRAGGHSRAIIPSASRARVPAPSPASAAKYKAAEELDAEMSDLAIRMASLGEGAEKLSLERAMRALTRNRDKLRMQADEAYARTLANIGEWY